MNTASEQKALGRRFFSLGSAVALAATCFVVAPSVSRAAEPSGKPASYVAENGDDMGDGSPDRPWKTIARAVKSLAPGNTLVIRAGTYNESVVFSTSGTADAPITVRGEGAVLIDGLAGAGRVEEATVQTGLGNVKFTPIAGASAFDTAGQSNIVIENFAVRNMAAATRVTRSSNITVIGIVSQNNGSLAVVENSSGVKITEAKAVANRNAVVVRGSSGVELGKLELIDTKDFEAAQAEAAKSKRAYGLEGNGIFAARDVTGLKISDVTVVGSWGAGVHVQAADVTIERAYLARNRDNLVVGGKKVNVTQTFLGWATPQVDAKRNAVGGFGLLVEAEAGDVRVVFVTFLDNGYHTENQKIHGAAMRLIGPGAGAPDPVRMGYSAIVQPDMAAALVSPASRRPISNSEILLSVSGLTEIPSSFSDQTFIRLRAVKIDPRDSSVVPTVNDNFEYGDFGAKFTRYHFEGLEPTGAQAAPQGGVGEEHGRGADPANLGTIELLTRFEAAMKNSVLPLARTIKTRPAEGPANVEEISKILKDRYDLLKAAAGKLAQITKDDKSEGLRILLAAQRQMNSEMARLKELEENPDVSKNALIGKASYLLKLIQETGREVYKIDERK